MRVSKTGKQNGTLDLWTPTGEEERPFSEGSQVWPRFVPRATIIGSLSQKVVPYVA